MISGCLVVKPLLFWADTLGARHTECVHSRGKWQQLKNSIIIYTCVSQQEAVLSVRCVRGSDYSEGAIVKVRLSPSRCTAIALKLNIYNTNPTVIVKN